MIKIISDGFSKKKIEIFLKSNVGSYGILYLGIMAIILTAVVITCCVDYSIYSMKKSIIGRGVDYSVCAAIQEIDSSNSSGINSEICDIGDKNIDSICVDEVKADKVFYTTLKLNTGIDESAISDYLMVIITNPVDAGLNYIIKKGGSRCEGFVASASDLEYIISAQIREGFSESYENHDEQVIYVNGNPKTNEFKKRPYYMVFIKDYEIDGLFKKRTATFVGFSGAKMERK